MTDASASPEAQTTYDATLDIAGETCTKSCGACESAVEPAAESGDQAPNAPESIELAPNEAVVSADLPHGPSLRSLIAEDGRFAIGVATQTNTEGGFTMDSAILFTNIGDAILQIQSVLDHARQVQLHSAFQQGIQSGIAQERASQDAVKAPVADSGAAAEPAESYNEPTL